MPCHSESQIRLFRIYIVTISAILIATNRLLATKLLPVCLLGLCACSIVFNSEGEGPDSGNGGSIDAGLLDANFIEIIEVVPIQSGTDHAEQECRDRVTVPCSNTPSTDPDDAWVTTLNGGSIALSNNSLSNFDRYVALRFQDVPICTGCEVLQAYVQFTAHSANDSDVVLGIRAQNTADAPPLTDGNIAVSALALAATGEQWRIEDPWLVGGAGLAERTPNLTAIMQEIVNLEDWTPGNSLVLVFTGKQGRRDAASFSTAAAPELRLRYRGPPAP